MSSCGRRQARSLTIREDLHGMVHLNARLDPATAAPVKAVLEAIVTDALRRARGTHVAGESLAGETSGPGAVVTETTERSAAVESTVGMRGRATVSALIAGMAAPFVWPGLVDVTRYKDTCACNIPGGGTGPRLAHARLHCRAG